MDFDVAHSKSWKIVSDPDLPYGEAPRPDVIVPSPAFYITVYVSPNDKARAISGGPFGSLALFWRVPTSDEAP